MVNRSQLIVVAPYWNVNRNDKSRIQFFITIVVAPYWNVNQNKIDDLDKYMTIVVAPYWNVNVGLYYYCIPMNRDSSSSILECKCGFILLLYTHE